MLSDGLYQGPDERDQEIFQATVPEDHYLRQVKAIIDFEACRDELAGCYCPTYGRPAMEPLLLLKLEFLQFHYNLSDRRVVYQARSDMAMRYFLDLSLHSPLPHHTLLTKFRDRLGPDKHQKVFHAIVAQARAHGLVKDRLRLKDATHVIANIAIPSTIQLVADTRDQLLQAARPYAAAQVAAFEAQRDAERLATADLSDALGLLHRVTHLRAIVAWADTLKSQLEPQAADTPPERLAEALRLAHKVLADREDPKAMDKVLSTQDVDARRGFHHRYFDGYKLDVLTDADSNIITGVNVLPGNGDECADVRTLITQEQEAHGNKVEALSIDSIGFRGASLREWTDPQGLNLEVFVPPTGGEASATHFMGEHFTLDAAGDRLTCPAGESTASRARSSNDTGWVYRFPASACRGCPLQQPCMEQMPKRGGRAVFKNDYEQEILAARAKARTPAFDAARRQHWRVERTLAEMVRWHGARRARYRGHWKVLLQVLMTSIVVNVKRVVHLLGARKVRAGLQASG
jgi:transposase